MTDQKRFQNKVIFITGGTSGIGLATAAQFARAGAAQVIVCGRRKLKWIEAQTYLQKKLTEAERAIIDYWPCDVRVESSVKAVIEKMFDQFGHVDVFFNNAGVQPGLVTGPDSGLIDSVQLESMLDEHGAILYRIPAPQPESPIAELNDSRLAVQTSAASPFAESELVTSCIGVTYCLKWETHYVLERQPKHLPVSIINTSSRNGILPDAHRPLYAASKAFIIAMTRSVANQMAQKSIRDQRQPIRVNVISPGPVDTPLEFAAYHADPSDPQQYQKYVKSAALGVPMQRTAQPEEIAPTVLFLGDENCSSYITGADISVDGGHTGSPLLTTS